MAYLMRHDTLTHSSVLIQRSDVRRILRRLSTGQGSRDFGRLNRLRHVLIPVQASLGENQCLEYRR